MTFNNPETGENNECKKPSNRQPKEIMTMEISHTPEAWETALKNLSNARKTPLKHLREALLLDDEAIWRRSDSEDPFSPSDYSKLDRDQLIELILERIRDHRSCTNDFEEFYMDRTGYYTVSVA